MTILDEPHADARGHRRPVVAAGVVVAALGVLTWWAWPTWSAGDAELDVLVAGDDMLVDARRSIELRVREEGMTIAWSAASSGWCHDAVLLGEEVRRRDPGRVVVSFASGADDESCVADVVDALDDRRVVVVARPGAAPPAVAGAGDGVDVLDPTRLLGGPDVTTRACEWWEECPPGGVVVRAADGRLTEAGGERLARMIVAALRG